MRDHPQFKAYIALAAVCLVWGTTYLAIRIALESVPPLLLVCTRYVLSGSIMMIGAVLLRVQIPRGRELFRTALNGVIILGIGNGCLAFAEQWIPSGLAALFITTSPFWMVGIEALVPGGEPLHAPTIAGMLIGLGGVATLVAPTGWGDLHGAIIAGFLTLQFGCAGWASGSILQRRHTTKAHPIINGAVQQLATGIVFLIPVLALRQHPTNLTVRSASAVLYLVVFGSIIGFSAYSYALSALPVAIVSIYTYVNPVVAVLLGWMVFREPFGIRGAVAMALIFAGVATVKRYSRKPAQSGTAIASKA